MSTTSQSLHIRLSIDKFYFLLLCWLFINGVFQKLWGKNVRQPFTFQSTLVIVACDYCFNNVRRLPMIIFCRLTHGHKIQCFNYMYSGIEVFARLPCYMAGTMQNKHGKKISSFKKKNIFFLPCKTCIWYIYWFHCDCSPMQV